MIKRRETEAGGVGPGARTSAADGQRGTAYGQRRKQKPQRKHTQGQGAAPERQRRPLAAASPLPSKAAPQGPRKTMVQSKAWGATQTWVRVTTGKSPNVSRPHLLPLPK